MPIEVVLNARGKLKISLSWSFIAAFSKWFSYQLVVIRWNTINPTTIHARNGSQCNKQIIFRCGNWNCEKKAPRYTHTQNRKKIRNKVGKLNLNRFVLTLNNKRIPANANEWKWVFLLFAFHFCLTFCGDCSTIFLMFYFLPYFSLTKNFIEKKCHRTKMSFNLNIMSGFWYAPIWLIWNGNCI